MVDFDRIPLHTHTVEVAGSNPVPPTSQFKGLRTLTVTPFYFLLPFSPKMSKFWPAGREGQASAARALKASASWPRPMSCRNAA